MVSTKSIEIRDVDQEGNIRVRDILELEINYKIDGQDNENTHTVIYDPEMDDRETDYEKRTTFFSKTGKSNYRIKILKKGIELAYKFNKNLISGFMTYDSKSFDLVDIEACEKSSRFNQSLTGWSLQTVGLPQSLLEVKLESTKVVEISEYDASGEVRERNILELNLIYKQKGDSNEHNHTVIYDPEMDDKIEDPEKRIIYYPKVGRENYRIERLKKGIESAYSKGQVLDFKCVIYSP